MVFENFEIVENEFQNGAKYFEILKFQTFWQNVFKNFEILKFQNGTKYFEILKF